MKQREQIKIHVRSYVAINYEVQDSAHHSLNVKHMCQLITMYNNTVDMYSYMQVSPDAGGS